MFCKYPSALVLLVSVLSAGATPAAAPLTPCAAVHIIAARASTEAPGAGIIGALVQQVQSSSSQTVSTSNVDYPATLTDYADSSAQGTAATKALLTDQANRCPNQKIVLVGYSQGAHIIGDAVAGGGGGVGLGPTTPPVPTNIANRVVAIVQMGDPRHVNRQPYNKGTALGSGLFPRLSSQQYSSTLQSRIQNYCDFGDTFCDSGLSTVTHLTYLSRYQNTAASFILTQIGG
ncbi:carbohydrate esterase family 5 protein [Crucibulum laeve]|uniref:Carbohydrate esterase family 5 protein n=1 Tax=Crucibulum laeve TaxID=68775 RepID=A0A5C3MD89_9AGAR|nr:carbohydrate esterase family 5 protein [Crucibulum laeve]